MTDPTDLDDARANRITEREADYLSPDEQACPACGGTGVRG